MRIELLGLPSELDAALAALRARLMVVSVSDSTTLRSGSLVRVDVEARMPAGPSGWMAVPTGHVPDKPEEILQALSDNVPPPETSGAGGRRPRRVGGGRA